MELHNFNRINYLTMFNSALAAELVGNEEQAEIYHKYCDRIMRHLSEDDQHWLIELAYDIGYGSPPKHEIITMIRDVIALIYVEELGEKQSVEITE